MTILKVKVPQKVIDDFPDVRWDSIARKAVLEEFRRISSKRMMDELFMNSELTDEDCLELGRSINRSIMKRYEKELDS